MTDLEAKEHGLLALESAMHSIYCRVFNYRKHSGESCNIDEMMTEARERLADKLVGFALDDSEVERY